MFYIEKKQDSKATKYIILCICHSGNKNNDTDNNIEFSINTMSRRIFEE